MDIRSLNNKSLYEGFANDSLSPFVKQDSKNQDAKDAKVAKEDVDARDKTEISQDNLDRIQSNGELSNVANTVNERVVNALKARLQSVESELKKLDMQMRNLSSGAQSPSARSVFAGQNLTPGVSGAGIASLAGMEEGMQNSANPKADKVAVREAMMKYLSVEKGIKVAEIMNLQRELARMQGLN